MQIRLSELLRHSAEQTLLEMVEVLFGVEEETSLFGDDGVTVDGMKEENDVVDSVNLSKVCLLTIAPSLSYI